MSEKSYAWNLLKAAPKGTTLYTIVRHVSQSGMKRVIDVVMIVDSDTRYLRSLADDTDLKVDRKHDGFIVNGVGMDMTAWLVMNIGKAVHGDDYYFTNRNL